MANRAQLIQIYQMTDLRVLASVVEVLSVTGRFNVDTRIGDRGLFLIVEGDDPADALNVYEAVVVADQETELIYSTPGCVEPIGTAEFVVNGWVVQSQRGLRAGVSATGPRRPGHRELPVQTTQAGRYSDRLSVGARQAETAPASQ